MADEPGVLRPHLPRTSQLRRACVGPVAVMALVGAAGCGGGEEDAQASVASGPVTAAMFCDEFLKRPVQERQEAAIRLSVELGMPWAGDPIWSTKLEERCAAAPDLKLQDFYNHFVH